MPCLTLDEFRDCFQENSQLLPTLIFQKELTKTMTDGQRALRVYVCVCVCVCLSVCVTPLMINLSKLWKAGGETRGRLNSGGVRENDVVGGRGRN